MVNLVEMVAEEQEPAYCDWTQVLGKNGWFVECKQYSKEYNINPTTMEFCPFCKKPIICHTEVN